ncbi:MAG: PQQ-dependent sugar dehydrogenase [Candidatus Hodarchaeota archaeon]
MKRLQHFLAISIMLLSLLQTATLLGISSTPMERTEQTGPTLEDPDLVVETVVTGLSQPTTMAFLTPDDLIILQKNNGQVRRVHNGIIQAAPALDVHVNNRSERGLLGVALAPMFSTNSYVYLYYTESSTGKDTNNQDEAFGNRVYRYTWDGEALIDPNLIFDLPFAPGPNHDGGIILFGPDDMLYVVIGDLNRNGQLQNFVDGTSPDDTSVILRLNPDGSAPPDNPFFNMQDPTDPINRYFAYGIRNSFGMAFDPVTGYLWDTENGPANYDEINIVPPGFNSGWEAIMGPDNRDSQDASKDLFNLPESVYRDPEFSWGWDAVGVTSLEFQTSPKLGKQYLHDMFVGDTNEGYLYHFELNEQRDGLQFTTPGLTTDLVADNKQELEEIIFGQGFGTITDIETGPDGWLYICSYSQGAIYRVRSAFETTVLTTTTIVTMTNTTITTQITITTIILPEISLFLNRFWTLLVIWGVLIVIVIIRRSQMKK